MVRFVLKGRVDRVLRGALRPLQGPLAALKRLLSLLLRWLIRLARTTQLRVQVGLRIAGLLVHPADPNNLFTVSSGTYDMAEAGRALPAGGLERGERRATLLIAAPAPAAGASERPGALAISLKGVAPPDPRQVTQEIARVNHRYTYLELLQTELRKVHGDQIAELNAVINRLTRRWLDLDQQFEPLEKRTRLDVQRTLRHNLPRYGGYILDFKWATRERPVPRFIKPARILAIGDVSHSMYLYATVSLYFLHMLNFAFQVDSYVFSQQATRSTPYLNGPGTFEEKLRELVQHARSWNAGTRFGSSLQQVVAQAQVDPYTYVIIATDGKVTLHHGEYELIHTYMAWIKQRARMVIFLTPEAAFANSHANSHDRQLRVEQVGAFQSGMVNIPIFDLGQIWYHTLGQYADRVYHVRTVQDLITTCEDLYYTSRG